MLRARDVIDLAFSIALLAGATMVCIWALLPARAPRFGPGPEGHRAGSPAPWGGSAARIGPRILQPLSLGLARAGIGANTVSWASLVLGICAGSTIGFGHFGVGAAMCLASSACDALDGRVARTAGTASRAGAVLEAAIDRYAELFVFGGIALALRHSAIMLVITLSAMAGAIMMSYAGAKAEALRVQAPGGPMGRHERALTLVVGAALVPIAAAVGARSAVPTWLSQLPLTGALALIAVVANASAIRRLAGVARAVHSARPARNDPKRGGEPGHPRGGTEIATNGHAAANDALH